MGDREVAPPRQLLGVSSLGSHSFNLNVLWVQKTDLYIPC